MGTTVVIRHDGGYVTTYSSLSSELTVAPGDEVSLGQAIGTVANTALLETAIGDHLHFSVSCDGKSVDPAQFLGLN
jgi:murein DD-endopeptidase MepM/ murein hydrolase activator NlpD